MCDWKQAVKESPPLFCYSVCVCVCVWGGGVRLVCSSDHYKQKSPMKFSHRRKKKYAFDSCASALLADLRNCRGFGYVHGSSTREMLALEPDPLL